MERKEAYEKYISIKNKITAKSNNVYDDYLKDEFEFLYKRSFIHNSGSIELTKFLISIVEDNKIPYLDYKNSELNRIYSTNKTKYVNKLDDYNYEELKTNKNHIINSDNKAKILNHLKEKKDKQPSHELKLFDLNENYFCKVLFELFTDYIIDYELPQQKERSLGKLDLLMFNPATNTLFLTEVKEFKNENESLLKAVLEIETYYSSYTYKKIQKIKEYAKTKSNKNPIDVKKAIIAPQSMIGKYYKEVELAKKLNISIFPIIDNNINIKFTESDLYLQNETIKNIGFEHIIDLSSDSN